MKLLYKKAAVIGISILVCFSAIVGYFFFTGRSKDDAGSSQQASKAIAGSEGKAPAVTGVKEGNFAAAAEYSRKYKGISMLVMENGKVIYEDYTFKNGANLPFELASATKSFNGIMAAAAVQDGLLSFDEKVSDTITEWKSDKDKANITIRQLLSLTGGFAAERLKGNLPTYAEAIKAPLTSKPGEKFAYSGLPFQVFGEMMKRKLAKLNEGPLDYLKSRIFDPIGLKFGGWLKDTEGDPHLASGARLTAREWAKFGELVRNGGIWEGKEIIKPELMDECFKGTKANPAYGLTWWMNREVSTVLRRTIPQLTAGTEDLWKKPGIPDDLVYAAGAGKQRLYISRSKGMVIVRQASGINEALNDIGNNAFRDLEFLRLIFDK